MDIEQPSWIEWTGGDCPVAPGTDCEVQFRNGYTSRDDDPEEWEWNRQSECRDYEIIAYRVWQTAWQAQALAAGWSPSTAPDLATVPAFESGQESMRGEIERLREALRWYASAFCEGFGECVGDFCGKCPDDDCSGCKAFAALEALGDPA